MAMKINNGISLGNIWTIAITLLALAVLWGSGQTKIQNVESDIEKLETEKADKDVIEVKLDNMSSQIAEIKEMLKEIK
jgi:Tfp pilus assembly protein PilO